MDDTDEEDKIRDREIARNESARETASAIRVSAWAVGVVIGLAAVGWVLFHNN